MGKNIFFALFLLLMPIAHSEILINEIMPNPIADESLNEWIELYNNGTDAVNVSGWIIGDSSDNDTIEGGLYNKEGAIIEPFGFAILTDDNTRVYNNFNASPDAARLYADDSSIGNGLLNGGELLYLYFNSTLIDRAEYPEAKEGFSISLANGTWREANPTPGYPNQNAVSHDTCDYEMSILLPNSVFESKNFSFNVRAFRAMGGGANISGNARIEDFFGNAVKEYAPWENDTISTKKTSGRYSPNLNAGAYIVSANLTTSCFDSNPENNFASEIFTIKGEKPKERSELKIKSILDLGSDKAVKFGDIARVSLQIYKGNTNKKSIALWLEDKKGRRLSKQSKANLGEKFAEYEITLPVQIIPNCDNEFEDGSYVIVAEGLDQKDEDRIEVEGISKSQCIEVKESRNESRIASKETLKSESPKDEPNVKSSSKSGGRNESGISAGSNKGKITSSRVQSPVSGCTAKPAVAYESSSEKSRKLAPIFLIILSVFLNIIFIWRR